MNRTKLVWVIFIALFIIFHTYTLSFSPLPWIDDTWYASVTLSYLNTGDYFLNVAPFAYDFQELLMHGPVFYILQSKIIAFFGFGIFQFRILGLLCGLLLLFVLYKIIRSQEVPRRTQGLLVILVAFDPLMHASMHNGRMDTLAMLMAFSSLYIFIIARKRPGAKGQLLFMVLSGVLGAGALLTTLRSVVIIFPIGVLLLARLLQQRSLRELAHVFGWILPILSFTLLWILITFGNLNDGLTYFKTLPAGLSGSTMFVPYYHILLVSLAVLSVLTGVILFRGSFFSQLNIIGLLAITIHFLFIRDAGSASVYIIPFYYLFMVRIVLLVNKDLMKKVSVAAIYILLILNLGLFGMKTAVIFAGYEGRYPVTFDEFIQQNIPRSSHVIGHETFYYSVIKAESDFQYFHLYNSEEEIVSTYQRDEYDYDYLIVSEEFSDRDDVIITRLKRDSQLEKLTEYSKAKSRLDRRLSSWGINYIGSYNCVIYQRIK
ncbi:MAG: glycosyltransferase family 39 protein [Bacteroidetes bacterium]|nr:glycosyltransferase family 39 protein [Bacteroidota bacterium]